MDFQSTALQMIRAQLAATKRGNPHFARQEIRQILARPEPIKMLALDISRLHEAASDVHPSPTEGQKEAGNYAKGHISWKGLPITIETAKGTYRRGVSKDGKSWKCLMGRAHYGYIKRTLSKSDDDNIDVFLCDGKGVGESLDSDIVFAINQIDLEGKFDEHKFILGCASKSAAKAVYLAAYSPGWKGCGSIVALTVPQFKQWLEHGDTSRAIGEVNGIAMLAAPPQEEPAAHGDYPTMLIAYLDALVDAESGDEQSHEVADELHGMLVGDGGGKEQSEGPEVDAETVKTLSSLPDGVTLVMLDSQPQVAAGQKTQTQWQRLPKGTKSPISGKVIRSDQAWYDPSTQSLVYGKGGQGRQRKPQDSQQQQPAQNQLESPEDASAFAGGEFKPGVARAHEIGQAIAAHARGEIDVAPTVKDYRELINLMPHLDMKQRVSIRNTVLSAFGENAAQKEVMANALREHVKAKIAKMGLNENDVDSVSGGVFGKDELKIKMKNGGDKIYGQTEQPAPPPVNPITPKQGPTEEATIHPNDLRIAAQRIARSEPGKERDDARSDYQIIAKHYEEQKNEEKNFPEAQKDAQYAKDRQATMPLPNQSSEPSAQPQKSSVSKSDREAIYKMFGANTPELKKKIDDRLDAVPSTGPLDLPDPEPREQATPVQQTLPETPAAQSTEVTPESPAISNDGSERPVIGGDKPAGAVSHRDLQDQQNRFTPVDGKGGEVSVDAQEPSPAAPEQQEAAPQQEQPQAEPEKPQPQPKPEKKRSLADMVKEHARERRKAHNEQVDKHNAMLKHATDLVSTGSGKKLRGGGGERDDWKDFPDFEDVAHSMGTYSHKEHFDHPSEGESDSYVQQLWDKIKDGRKKRLTQAEAERISLEEFKGEAFDRNDPSKNIYTAMHESAKKSHESLSKGLKETELELQKELDDARVHTTEPEISEAVRRSEAEADASEPSESLGEDSEDARGGEWGEQGDANDSGLSVPDDFQFGEDEPSEVVPANLKNYDVQELKPDGWTLVTGDDEFKTSADLATEMHKVGKKVRLTNEDGDIVYPSKAPQEIGDKDKPSKVAKPTEASVQAVTPAKVPVDDLVKQREEEFAKGKENLAGQSVGKKPLFPDSNPAEISQQIETSDDSEGSIATLMDPEEAGRTPSRDQYKGTVSPGEAVSAPIEQEPSLNERKSERRPMILSKEDHHAAIPDLRKRLGWLDQSNYDKVSQHIEAASEEMSVSDLRDYASKLTGIPFKSESRKKVLDTLKNMMESVARSHSQTQGIGNEKAEKPDHLKTGDEKEEPKKSPSDSLSSIPQGDRSRVNGFMVQRQGPDAYRIENQSGKGYVAGTAAEINDYIDRELKSQKAYGKQLPEALARAESFEEPDWTDAAGTERAARGFDSLPKDTPVVSLDEHAGTHGRTGRIVKDEQGRNRVKLDGEDGYATNHVEPMNKALSWRKPVGEDAAKPEKMVQGSLLARQSDGTVKVAIPQSQLAESPHHATVDKWLEHGENAKIHPERRKMIGDSLKTTISRMHPKAADAAMANLASPPTLYNSVTQLTMEYNNESRRRGEATSLHPVAGYYDLNDDGKGTLHLDYSRGEDEADAVWTHAHEIHHAIDGNDKFSGTPEWQSAYKKEIYVDPKLPEDKHPLSRHASSRPNEGFAEFGAMIVADPEMARDMFPECYAFFNKQGFI